ncbi:MAG TPA: lipoprotein [Gaiellaceae bacterium]|nr:lipoprotein [Gaiellaceae bacterium]
MRRLVLLAGAAVLLAGCTSWRDAAPGPAAKQARLAHGSARLYAVVAR